MVDSWSATRRALAGVSNISLAFGRLPALNWRPPSANIPPATPPTMRAMRVKRLTLDVGIARELSSLPLLFCGIFLLYLPTMNV